MKKCPFCAESIQDQAIKCKHCGEFLQERNKDKWYFRSSWLIVCFLCAGPLVLPLVWLKPGLPWRKKIIISIVVLGLTYVMVYLTVNALTEIKRYYNELFQSFY